MITQNWKNNGEGQFEYRQEEGGEVKGYMELLRTDSGKLVIKHTEVSAGMEGKGIGKQLLDSVVNFCRENDLKILPVCPFAKNLMYRFPDLYKDML